MNTDYGQKIIRNISSECDDAIFNSRISKRMMLEINNGKITNLDFHETLNNIIKVYVDGKEGIAASKSFDLNLGKKAIKIAKVSPKKEYHHGIPNLSSFPEIKTFDKKVQDIEEEKAIDIAKTMIFESSSDKTVLGEGSLGKETSETLTLNSNGVEVIQKFSEFGLGLEIVAKDKGKISTYWEGKNSVNVFDPIELIKNTKKFAIGFLNPKNLEKKKMIVLSPSVVSELVKHSMIGSFNAKNVEKKNSKFSDRIIELNKELDIYDQGNLDFQINSAKCDFEGSPQQKTHLVKKGVINSFLYDYNTAKQVDRESTGNSDDRGISPSNIIINGRSRNIDQGLYIDSIIGSHTSDPVSGRFSVKAEKLFLIDGGHLTPLKPGIVSGNIFDVLQNVESIGRDVESRDGVITGPLASSSIHLSQTF